MGGSWQVTSAALAEQFAALRAERDEARAKLDEKLNTVTIKAAVCAWCSATIAAHLDLSASLGDVVRAHDMVCEKNPTVAALAAARARCAELEAALREARNKMASAWTRIGSANEELSAAADAANESLSPRSAEGTDTTGGRDDT